MKKDNLDASWDWIAFWGENDPSIAFLEETGYFPSSTIVAQDKRITGNPLYLPAMKTQQYGTLPPSFVGYPGWAQNVVLPEFQKILIGQSTPEKATDAILKGLDAAIQ
jgi:multiple sugar transport system substrate-binding protein